jgi:tripartite-type tricarboxylate transporter receptor subunit TctC
VAQGGKQEETMKRREFLSLAGGLAASALAAPGVRADTWPSRNISFMIPFPPGGTNDILARAISDKLAASLGVPVILDNRGGAAGTIGTTLAARAAPDGYTIMVGHIGTLGVNPTLFPNLPYDTLKSFDYIAPLALVPNIMVVHPSLPVKSVQELIDLAHAKPGKLNYATAGQGSAAHIAMAAFNVAAKTEMIPVPYRGTNPAVIDLLAGQVQLTMTGATAVLQHVRTGGLRGLGVSTLKRLKVAPEIPAIAETLPGFEASQWYGIVAPAGVPQEIRERLTKEIKTIMQSPELQARLETEGADYWDVTPDEFRAHVASEIPRWKKVVDQAKIVSPK